MAPASSAILAEIVVSVFETGHVSVVEGDAEISRELLEQKFDVIFYTGSEKVGKIVAKAAAKTLTPTILELGGKCPCVVDQNVDLDIAAKRIAAGKFFNAGQTCFAPDFVIAHQTIRSELAQKIEANLSDFYCGDLQRDFARIVSDSHFERLRGLVGEESKECVTIGSDDAAARLFAPRIQPMATWESRSMKEEIFGPILPILEFRDQTSLIEDLRKLTSPLALYLFSTNHDFVETMAAAIPSGSIGINDVMKQSSNLELPFGGVGTSGMGRYRGKFGLEAFTYARAVTKRPFRKDLFAIVPPYEGKWERFRKFLK